MAVKKQQCQILPDFSQKTILLHSLLRDVITYLFQVTTSCSNPSFSSYIISFSFRNSPIDNSFIFVCSDHVLLSFSWEILSSSSKFSLDSISVSLFKISSGNKFKSIFWLKSVNTLTIKTLLYWYSPSL